MALLANRMAALGTENAFKLGVDIARCESRGMDVIKFNLGEPDFDSAAHINAAGIAQIEAGNSHYCDPQGILPLRRAIARHIGESRDLDVDVSRIVVTPGAKPPIGYTLQTYVDPGDEVIYPSPGFPIYESWVTYAGATPVPLQLSEESGFAFTPEELGALITERTKVIMLCSPSNPTGGVLPAEDFAGIADVVREKCSPDVRIYSDEIYEHILFDGETHHSITAEEGMEACTVMVSGHSKGFAMTGWRLGWAVLPTPEEAAVFKQLNINICSCVPPFIQEAGREAYESEKSAATVATMVAAFERRRDWVVPALNAIPGVRCQQPKGAFYVFPNIARTGYSSKVLADRCLEEAGVACLSGTAFGEWGEGHLRFSYANSLENIEEALRRVKELLAKSK